MRFAFWLWLARFLRSLMMFACKRAMKADPRVVVVASFSEAMAAMMEERAKAEREGRAN